MYIHEMRNQVIVLPGIEDEDLLVYGIQKFKQQFKVVSMKETISPEGGEWVFVYDKKLRIISIQKQGQTFQFIGSIDEDLADALKSIFKISDD